MATTDSAENKGTDKSLWEIYNPFKYAFGRSKKNASNSTASNSNTNNTGTGSEQNTEPKTDANNQTPSPPNTDPFETYTKKAPEYFESDLEVQKEVLKQLGFYTAIEHPEPPYERFQNLITLHNQRIAGLTTKTSATLTDEITRYSDKVTHATTRKLEIEKAINRDITITNNLPARLEVAKNKIYKFFLESDDKRRAALDKRMKEIQEMLKNIIARQKELLQSSDFPVKGYFDKASDLAKNVVKRYEELAETVNTRLQGSHKILQSLDVQGVSPGVLDILNHFGYLCAIIAGWFFYNFYNPATGGDGIFSKLYAGLKGFFHGYSILAGIGLIGAFLLVTSLISGFCEWVKWIYIRNHDKEFSPIITKRQDEDKTTESKFTLGAELSELNALPLSINITSNSWFEFWMEALPVLFIVLIAILVLAQATPVSTGTGADQTGSSSFLTELVGFIMTTVAGGAFYFYLMRRGKKITSQTPQQPAAEQQNSWSSRNGDLIWLLVFLSGVDILAVLIALAMGINNMVPSLLFKQLLALSEFIVFMNLGGLCIGFATYCKGLINNVSWLEYKLDVTHTKLRYFFHQSIALFFTNDFRKVYQSLFEDLLNLLERRLTAGRKFNLKKNTPAQQAAAIAAAVAAATRNEPNENIWQLSDDDRLYYPELVAEFESYNKERIDILRTMAELNREKETLVSQINNWSYLIDLIKTDLPHRIKYLENLGNREQVYLMDGFDLGIWYRENEMGPRDGYYVNRNQPNGN